MTEPIESWRKMEPDQLFKFFSWVENGIDARITLGQERYQSHIKGFQGDPLDHAIEEALDLLLYLWIAKRRQAALAPAEEAHDQPEF